jgi:hypothetical protein
MELDITAEDTASSILDKVNEKLNNLGLGGGGKLELLTANLNTLGVKSDDVFDRMVRDSKAAFEAISTSGVASSEKIARAETALAKKMDQVHKDSAGAFGAAMKQNETASTGFFAKMKAGMSSLKEHWIGATAAIAGAMGAIMTAWDLAQKSAAFAEQKDSLNALAAQYKTSADTMIGKIKEITGGQVSMAEAADVAASGLQKSLNPDQIYAMATAAEKLSNITGSDIPTSFSKMVDAIALGREKALENELGAISLEETYGKVVNTWTDAEKVAGRLAIVMDRTATAAALLGDGAASTDDKINAFKKDMDDLKLKMGDAIIQAGAGVIAIFHGMASAALSAGAALLKVSQGVAWLVGDKAGFEELGLSAAAAFEAAKDEADKAASAWGIAAHGMSVAAGKYNEAAAAAKALAAAHAESTASITKGITDLKTVISTWASYYNEVKSAHERAVNEIETRQKAHAAAMKAIDEAMKAGTAALNSIAPEAREGEAWLKEKERLQNLYNDALKKEGTERTNALKDYMEQRAKFTKGISDEALGIEQQIGSMQAFKQEAVTAGDAIAQAQKDIKAAMGELKAEQDRIIEQNDKLAAKQEANAAALKTAMDAALLNVKNYQNELDFLTTSLEKQRVLTVDTDAALAGAQGVKRAIDAIPDVSYKTVIIKYDTQGSPAPTQNANQGSEQPSGWYGE